MTNAPAGPEQPGLQLTGPPGEPRGVFMTCESSRDRPARLRGATRIGSASLWLLMACAQDITTAPAPPSSPDAALRDVASPTDAGIDAGTTTSTTPLRCSPLPRCPAGEICRVVPSRGRAVSACAVGAKKGLGEICFASDECETPLCATADPQSTFGYCVDACTDDRACPPGFQCIDVRTLGVPICAFFNDDVTDRGPGEACGIATNCTSGLCVFDESRGAFCTFSCSANATACAQLPGTTCVAGLCR